MVRKQETVKYRRLYMCCPYSIYSRLGLVLLNKWSSSRWETVLDSAAGEMEEGKEADCSRYTGRFAGQPGWEEKEPACFSPPLREANRQEWYVNELLGMAGEVCWRTAFGVHWTVQMENLKARPDFPRFLPVDWGHFKAWQSKVIPLSLGVANVGAVWAEGQQKLEIHLQKIHLGRTGNKIISARHPALPFSKVLSLLRSFFFMVDFKEKLQQRSYLSMKNNPFPTLFWNNQRIKCMHTHAHPKTMQQAQKLWTLHLHLHDLSLVNLWV